MSDALTRAIRSRDLRQATDVIAQMQGHMSNDHIIDLIIAAVERLAWDEGDRSAATWILRNTHRTYKRRC